MTTFFLQKFRSWFQHFWTLYAKVIQVLLKQKLKHVLKKGELPNLTGPLRQTTRAGATAS